MRIEGIRKKFGITEVNGVNIQVKVFWVVIQCSDVVGYLCLGRLCCLHLQGPTKHWYPTATPT
jgi:hypothetical protein